MLAHEIGPYDYVPIFYSGETTINVLLSGILFRSGEKPIQIGSVRFILPMVFKRMNIYGMTGFRRSGFQRRCHCRNIAGRAGFRTCSRPIENNLDRSFRRSLGSQKHLAEKPVGQ